MNSGTNQELLSEDPSICGVKPKPSQFNLSSDQFTIIQYYLPKGYALVEKRGGTLNYNKRERGSVSKLQDSENRSKFSAGNENAEQTQGRSKRNKIKKIDRYLQDQMPKPNRRVPSEKSKRQENANPYMKILITLKRNANSFPFLEPVNPTISGASNYFDIIKQPMDLATVEKNYNRGVYSSLKEFNDDVGKIWKNSYEYNDSGSQIHKMTIEMEKLHNKLMSGLEANKSNSVIRDRFGKNISERKPENLKNMDNFKDENDQRI